MVVGAALLYLSLQLADARTDAERLFEYRVVGPLDTVLVAGLWWSLPGPVCVGRRSDESQ